MTPHYAKDQVLGGTLDRCACGAIKGFDGVWRIFVPSKPGLPNGVYRSPDCGFRVKNPEPPPVDAQWTPNSQRSAE